MAKAAPKTFAKLTLEQKKKFVQLNADGAYNDAYAAYLNLNQAEIQFYKGQIDTLKKEVEEAADVKAEKIAKLQREAQKINEATQKGEPMVKAPVKKASHTEEWRVPKDKVGDFLRDASIRDINFLANKYKASPAEIDKEVARLEQGV